MTKLELLLVSTTPDVKAALGRYAGLEIATAPTLDIALRFVKHDRPPDALYLEDTGGSLAVLWSTVEAARERGVLVAVGLQRAGKLSQHDFDAAGVATIVPEAGAAHLQAPAVAAFIARLVGAREKKANHRQALIAVGGAKGGVGKSLVSSLLAEVLVRAGLRVLVVDGDVSNTGLASIFRFRPGLRSYVGLAANGDAHWSPALLADVIYSDRPSGIHFLVGADDAADDHDLLTPQWQAMMQAVREMEQYDVVVVDTSPDIRKRPYIVLAALDGGVVVLPSPPGRKERDGAGKALRILQTQDADLTSRCFLVMMEPERGVDIGCDRVAQQFLATYPQLNLLGTLPRAPRLISRADEPEQYLCPLDLAPHSRFALAVYGLGERLCGHLAITLPKPLPRPRWWDRLRGERVAPLPPSLPPRSFTKPEVPQ